MEDESKYSTVDGGFMEDESNHIVPEPLMEGSWSMKANIVRLMEGSWIKHI